MACERFQILSLDGGGLKGIFSAAMLMHIEDDLKIRVADHFDLIVGTSTGGIIALGLGAGMTPREIVKFYIKHGPEIFPSGVGSIQRWWKTGYRSKPLELALKSCLREKCLADSTKRLVIPSYNLGDDDIYLFKTPHHPKLCRDGRVMLWQVAMATTAAPTYLRAFEGLDRIRLIDGGVWANNPTMIGVIEAVSLLHVPLSAIKVLSLGTTDEVVHRPKQLDTGGKIRWSETGVEVILRGQSIGATTQAQHLLGKDSVVRFDPRVPAGIFALDKSSDQELLSKAAHESRKMMPVFQEKFAKHIATQFVQITKEQ